MPLDLDTCKDDPPPGQNPPPPGQNPPPPGQNPPPAQNPHASTPAAGQQVLGAQQAGPRQAARGGARLRGPSGCVPRPFTARVHGRQVRRVTFFLDGRRLVVRRARRAQRTFTARVTPGRLSLGVHRVTARVVFRSTSRTRPRTLVLSFQRCAQQAPAPRFTG